MIQGRIHLAIGMMCYEGVMYFEILDLFEMHFWLAHYQGECYYKLVVKDVWDLQDWI